jgi:alkylated DNA repair dioxygenase AlkB
MKPEGLVYEPEFIDARQEARLLETIAALPLEPAPYREYTARRRIVVYDEPPPFLVPLRDRVAAWLQVEAAHFSHVLINEYRPGTPLGWHRDSPEFELVAGVSLGTPCRLRFRPWPHVKGRSRADVLALELAPRSAYVLRSAVRWRWQHSVPAVPALRYSVTFRTLRAQGLHRASHGYLQAPRER